MIKKLQIGSLSFQDNSTYFIQSFKGLEMPQTRIVQYNLAGEHFGYFVNALYGIRKFSFQGWVIGSSVADFISKREALESALNVLQNEQTVKITLVNEKHIQIDAVLEAIDFGLPEGSVAAAPFNIQFSASFPFLVSQNEYSNDVGLSSGGGGKVPPDTMPTGLASGTNGVVYAVNNGNAIYYPTTRFLGPATNPAVRNNTLGKEIRLTIALALGEYIDVSFRRKTVVDNLGRNRYDTKEGDWWYLQSGTNEVQFTADVYNAQSSLNFKWRDSYLGI